MKLAAATNFTSSPGLASLFFKKQRQPVTSAAALVRDTGLALATVNRALVQLSTASIVEEVTQRQRNRIFSYRDYVATLNTEL